MMTAPHVLTSLVLVSFAVAACGGTPPASPSASIPVPDAGQVAPTPGAPGEAAAAAEDSGSVDAGAGDSGSPSSLPDAAMDPCVQLSAEFVHCSAIAGTPASLPDAIGCVDAMTLSRQVPACMTDAQRASLDQAVLTVVESSLSLHQAACDVGSLQQELRLIDRYARVARSIVSPAEPLDVPTLTRLDNAFWNGVYWGDPRASAFDRSTLRTIRRGDALPCAQAALDAALTPSPGIPMPVLTGSPIVGVVSEALAALEEGYERTTFAHEFACPFTTCAAIEEPGAGATWASLAVLDDAASLNAALGPSPTPAVWGSTLTRFAAKHTLFEDGVTELFGVPAYSPSLLVGTQVPAVVALVAAESQAGAATRSYQTTQRYFVTPTNDLYAYPLTAGYATNANNDLVGQVSLLDSAVTSAADAQKAFEGGYQSSYDVRPLQAARHSAALWTATHITPIVNLREPGTLLRIAQNNEPWLLDLVLYPDGPMSSDDFAGVDVALRDIESAFSAAVGASGEPPLESVAVSFPNPAHVAGSGERTNPWRQVDAARAKAVWDAISSAGRAAITLVPTDVYSANSTYSVLNCGMAAPVIRGMGFVLEYAPSAVPSHGAPLELNFGVSSPQPFVTAGAQLLSFTSDVVGTQAATVPVAIASDNDGWTAASPIVALGTGNGASPFATFVMDFSEVAGTLGAKGMSAPRSLTLFFDLDVAPITEGSLTWVTTCQ